MKYEDLITTVTTIVNDETISKRGLVLMYNLDETSHNKINEELFYKTNPVSMGSHQQTSLKLLLVVS